MAKFFRTALLISVLSIFLLSLSACNSGVNQSASEKMIAGSLATLIEKFDEDAVVSGNSVSFTVNEREIFLVYDENADKATTARKEI